MRKMLLFFSHKLTPAQVEDAQKNWKVKEFLYLPQDLQYLFSNVPPELERLEDYAEPLKRFLTKEAKKDDIALIQGDFGLCFILVKSALKNGVVPVYATTKRHVVESESEGERIKISRFEHVRFRRYE